MRIVVIRYRNKSKPIKARLRKIAGSEGIALLAALFERTQSQPWVNARQFRIDFKDERDTIGKLVRKGFISTMQEPEERYRPSLAALPLIDSNAARSLLKEADQVLRYLERQYEAGCDRNLTIAQIAQDLDIPQGATMEVLRYIVDTPVVGPRATGFPNSPDWGLTPAEKSLDYPNLDALLNQLTSWMDQRDFPAPRVVYPLGLAHQSLPVIVPSTHYDRLINRIKNSPVAASFLAVFFVMGVLAAGLESGRELVAMIFSLSWIQGMR